MTENGKKRIEWCKCGRCLKPVGTDCIVCGKTRRDERAGAVIAALLAVFVLFGLAVWMTL